MNTYTKFIPRLFAVVLLFFSSFNLYGQEKIRETIDYLICDTSIVREVSKDIILNYNHTNSTSTFMMVNNIASNTITMYIEPLFINDFEIYFDWVFFCGYTFVDESESTKKAIVGYFPLGLFPVSSLNYYVYDDYKEFKKLDVYETAQKQKEQNIHLVMTGSTEGIHSNAIVDMAIFATPTTFAPFITKDKNENFDDVAVTESYIVVSSRNKVMDVPIINFLYFKKPLNTTQNIFTNPYDKFRVTNPVVESPVFLEFTHNNNFVATYKIEGFSRIAMLALSVTNTSYRAFEILANQSWPNIPIDIKYQGNEKLYCILARVKTGYSPIPPTRIYRVTSDDLLNITSNGQGIKYTKDYSHFWSLDRATYGTQLFVTSGSTGHLSRMLWFNPLLSFGCAERFDYQYNVGDLDGNLEKDFTTLSPWNTIPLTEKMTRVITIPLHFTCGSF